MSSRLDGTLSVDLGTLTDSEPSNGELHPKNNDFHRSVQDEDDQVFTKNNDLVSFKTTDNSRHLEANRILQAQKFGEAAKSLCTSLGSGSSNLQAPGNEVIQNGGLDQLASSASSKTQTSGGTPRRPSYTSKAPSALNTLPGITISEYSPVRSNFDDTAQTQSLNQINHSASRKHSLASYVQGSKDQCILPSQSSFDESLDGYSNPGTPSSVKTDSPAPSPSGGHHHVQRKGHGADIREKNRVSFKSKWDEAAKSDVLVVKCRNNVGELHKNRLGSGSKGKCIKVNDSWFTPTEFEQLSGRGACKDWKRSIRFAGFTLHKLIDDAVIAPHAVSCTCSSCCGEESMTSTSSSNLSKGGPVKLFVPYTKTKRKRRDGEGSVSKRLSTGGEDNLKDLHRGRSFSMDSEVFPGLVHTNNLTSGDLDDGNMPPMTPVTPMTPITPITPFTPMTPLTPNALRSGSPPKHSSLVTSNLGLPSMAVASSASFSSAILRPPATPTKSHPTTNTDHPLANQHWLQLEEMSTSLISMAQQLKFMIDQAKVQSDALRDTAVTQAKIHAESDKREAINQVRLQSISQLSQALSAAQADRMDLQTIGQQITIIKNCQNCSRDALLECTGCHKVYYCSPFCQRKDWVNHQKICGDQQTNPEQGSKQEG